MTTTRTFTVTIHNEYSFNDGYTVDEVRESFNGSGCSPECEGLALIVDSIEEVTTDG